MTQHSIPDVVTATVGLHRAETELRLARVREELDRTGLTVARSKTLRSLRAQLTEQLGAWDYLAVLTRDGGHYQEYRELNG